MDGQAFKVLWDGWRFGPSSASMGVNRSSVWSTAALCRQLHPRPFTPSGTPSRDRLTGPRAWLSSHSCRRTPGRGRRYRDHLQAAGAPDHRDNRAVSRLHCAVERSGGYAEACQGTILNGAGWSARSLPCPLNMAKILLCGIPHSMIHGRGYTEIRSIN